MQMNVSQIEARIRQNRAGRDEIRKMKKLLSEQGGSKVSEAFKDIFRALRLTAMDLGNTLRLAVGVLITFDPEKMKEKVKAFDERRQRINSEWKPIMDRAREAIESTDPILMMAVIGPSNFLAAQGVGAALLTGKTVVEALSATQWDSIINSFTTTLDVNQNLQKFFSEYSENERRRRADDDERDYNGQPGSRRKTKAARLTAKLRQLFAESHETRRPILEQKKNEKLSEDEALKMFLLATGLDKKFEETSKSYKTAISEVLIGKDGGLLSSIEPMVAVSEMFAAKNTTEFQSAITLAKNKNPKLKEEPFKKFLEQVNQKTNEILNDPKAVENIKKGLSDQEAKGPQLQKTAQQVVFVALKADFDKQIAKSIESARNTAKDAIQNLKIDMYTLKEMEKSKDSEMNDIANIYKQLLSAYDSINKDYENKSKSRSM